MPRPTDPMLPKNYVRPCILLLLREQPGHGYDLLERLVALGFDRDDPARLYRALRGLEADGLVRSAWEPSTAGPARRMYELTRRGMEELHAAARALDGTRAALDTFLSRYGEFATVSAPRVSERRATDR